MAESLVIAAAGSGTVGREEFLASSERQAASTRRAGAPAKVEHMAGTRPARGFAEKDPRGWAEFLQNVGDHSGRGLRADDARRDDQAQDHLRARARAQKLVVPSLIVVGDQDEPCIEPGIFMKRHIPHAGLLMVPMTGHTVNIEEPGLFNPAVAEFLPRVESGRWGTWKGRGR